jgi:hypothetical protein
MRISLLIASLWLATAAAAQPAAPIRTLHDEMPVGAAPSFQVKSEFGQLVVEGWDEPSAQAEISITCKSGETEACRAAADAISFSWTRGRDQLQLRTRGSSRLSSRHLTIETRVKVPANLPLELDLVGGTVEVRGMQNSVEADMGSGDLTMRLPRSAVRSVNLKVGAGNVELYVAGGKIEGSGLFRGLNWQQGEGRSAIEVDMGTGNAVVRLD